MSRIFVVIASLLGATGVALGAFGAHALKTRVDEHLLDVWDVAVRYHLIHALALFAAAWLVDRGGPASAVWAGWLLIGGVVIFSGSLYLMTLGGPRWLGAITPIGGVALITGWLLMAWSAWRSY